MRKNQHALAFANLMHPKIVNCGRGVTTSIRPSYIMHLSIDTNDCLSLTEIGPCGVEQDHKRPGNNKAPGHQHKKPTTTKRQHKNTNTGKPRQTGKSKTQEEATPHQNLQRVTDWDTGD
ncbi:hypothetical protein QYF36_024324 [Acer negundo]|nr:hypothetical protein QYF36_024324 [Acer negundo]